MRGFFLIIFFFIIVVIAVVYGAPSISTRSDPVVELKPSSEIPSSTSLLPVKTRRNTAIVAALDGTILLMELKSGEILWSFMSGASIYSSYQGVPDYQSDSNNFTIEKDIFYIDCGEDWKLYIHRNGFKKEQLQFNAEDILKHTPYFSASGIMVGSKKTTVFVVDAKTGKLISSVRSEGSPLDGDTDVGQNPILAATESLNLLYIMRTDYTLKYISLTGKVLWYLMFADFEASQQCENIESFIGGFSDQEDQVNSGNVFCSKNPAVHRVRDRKAFESLFPHIVLSFRALQNNTSSYPIAELESPQNKRPCISGQVESDALLNPTKPNDHKSAGSFFPQDVLSGDGVLTSPVLQNIISSNPLAELESPQTKSPYALLPYTYKSRQIESDALVNPTKPNVCELLGTLFPRDVLSGDGVDTSVFQNNTSSNPPALINKTESQVGKSDAIVHPYIWSSVILSMLAAISCTVWWKKWKLHEQVTDPKLQALTSKKKKARKSGLIKNSTRSQKNKKKSKNDYTEESDEFSEMGRSEKVLKLNLSKYDSLGYHRKIGKLLVSNTEIAKGSNGTVVFEGIYDGRPVAVKRLVQAHHEVALKEIQNLIASDQHPNIVRWYGVEYDQDFVYLSLERCTCSLYEFISSFSSSYQKKFSGNDKDACFSDCTVQFQWKSDDKEDSPLWKPNGYPSPHLLKLMRDMVHGLAHLHELGIVHRDLKPQNVLVVKERAICAKLSDMGISKRLAGDMSSLTKNSTGSGSSGWQAPEQLRQGRQTRAVDLFSLGCLLFFCITGGKHPFGDSFERDVNIANNQKDLFLIENIPEAADLISALLHPNPELRPKAVEIPHHPFFWDSEMRLSFLRDASDRVELEDRENGSELLEALENVKTVALGGLWNEKMDSAFINDIGRYRRYKYDSVRDLLRVIRNKLNHYRELSKEIQGILGQVPEGFDSYFSTRFPRLVIEVYKIFRTYCIEEDIFQKYFKSNQI